MLYNMYIIYTHTHTHKVYIALEIFKAIVVLNLEVE